MKRFILCMTIFMVALPAGSACAVGIDGRTYYSIMYDVSTQTFQNFSISFTANSSSDNATDNETDGPTLYSGTFTIDIENRNYDNETSSYQTVGSFFNGTWSAAEAFYSSYYQTTIRRYYSFLFFGMSFGNNFFIAGYAITTITEESTAKGYEKYTGTAPFYGIQTEVSTSRAGPAHRFP